MPNVCFQGRAGFARPLQNMVMTKATSSSCLRAFENVFSNLFQELCDLHYYSNNVHIGHVEGQMGYHQDFVL